MPSSAAAMMEKDPEPFVFLILHQDALYLYFHVSYPYYVNVRGKLKKYATHTLDFLFQWFAGRGIKSLQRPFFSSLGGGGI